MGRGRLGNLKEIDTTEKNFTSVYYATKKTIILKKLKFEKKRLFPEKKEKASKFLKRFLHLRLMTS